MKERFFDRKTYLDLIEKRVSALKDGYRQNIAIIGDEFVGKTSIIFKFLEKFYDNKIILCYIETRTETLSSFANRLIGVILYNFLSKSDIPLKEDLSILINKSVKYIPKTVEKINSILAAISKRKKTNIFPELLSLCDSINQETGKHCVVIFDEFQNLDTIGINNIYSEWAKLILLQKTTMYIILSSTKYKAKTILSKNLSLLFGNFEVIAVEPFDAKISEDYLDNKLYTLNINTGLKNFIVHFTGGYPSYLELICESLIKSKGENISGILEELFFNSQGILNERFSHYLKRFLDKPYTQDYIEILYLVANGHTKIKDVAHLMKKSPKELLSRINYLSESDALSKSGDFIKLTDRVFGFWLRFVYQEKLHSLSFDSRKQKTQFRDNISAIIDEFLANADKSITEIMLDLVRQFEDEVVQIEKKKLKLTHFREIKPLEFASKNLRNGLIGRSNDSTWIMAFKEGVLTEDDILEFSKECKKYQNKLERKIIVTLSGAETNARLMAMDEKIWTWDLNSVNQILDLYSKPRLIA